MVLSTIYATEVCCVEVESGLIYKYGEDKGYESKVFLLYTGIHYDALVVHRGPHYGDRSADVLQFPKFDLKVDEDMKRTSEEFRKKKMFTNVAKFTLRCSDCGENLIGT